MSRQPVDPPDLLQVPRDTLNDLIRVAEYVSIGRGGVDHQPDGAPYPDAVARRALGALDEHGLLGPRCTCSAYPAPHTADCAITEELPRPVTCACGDGSGVPHSHPRWSDPSPRILSAQQAPDGRHCEIRQQRGGDETMPTEHRHWLGCPMPETVSSIVAEYARGDRIRLRDCPAEGAVVEVRCEDGRIQYRADWDDFPDDHGWYDEDDIQRAGDDDA